MVRRLLPGGLRAQMALSIALVAVLAVGASFLAVYSATISRLRSQIDAVLRTQRAEWQQFTAHATISTPVAFERTARAFITSQRYHAESLIIVIQTRDGGTLSNHPSILAQEEARERSSPADLALLKAPTGFSTVPVAGAGTMRVLSQPIDSGAQRVGMLRVANPLTTVERAQVDLQQTFLVVGAIALGLAAAAGFALATLIASPLRRMARVAAAVEGGDLSMRSGRMTAHGEVRVLATAFDHMLERLERAFKRQRDFVSDASHELRTPLAVLRAQVELLDREAGEARRREGTATLLRRLDELDRLVADMLTLASAEGGQLVERRPIELIGFFEDLRRDLPLYGERDFQLRPVDGILTADPDRLTQVLRNLIRNAVAHTDPGGCVVVAAHVWGSHLEISVADDGPGIPPDQLEQIFERFRRLDGSRARDRGGSGLGLAIARAIVEAHGGHITAESSPGHGATFRLDLPGYRSA